jgi:uncharacterized protein (DUF1800 family)
MLTDIVHAYARFGFGRAPTDPAPADVRAWLAGQLNGDDPGPPGATVADAFAALAEDRQDKGQPDRPHRARDLFQAETKALEDNAIATTTPFRERLVWFWANHFTVSIRRGEVAPMAGAYIREAIRPHVTGRFRDMLLAVMQHPAMLLYLDNAGSFGPNSRGGQRQNKGLNENLARECLELHTVSPAAGYTQDDVIALAKLITGWSVERRDNPGFRFRPQIHEPGDKTLLGRTFPEGQDGGQQALLFLADHPYTQLHIATKLVRHFVADNPPPHAVRRLQIVLRATGGDLRAASLELIRLPGAWTPLAKLRTPQELVLAAVRGAGLPPDRRPPFNRVVNGLGQGMFNAPFPIGWPDTAADWAGPEAMVRRIDWVYGFADRAELAEPATLSDTVLGPLLSPATASALRTAGSRRDAITLLLASPEFQRR